MPAPTTLTDANGRLVVAGNGVVLTGVVQSVNSVTGVATIELTDAYLPESNIITTPCYNIRVQKLKQ